MNWNKYPFLRLVAALTLGISLQEVLGSACPNPRWLWAALLVLIVTLIVLHRTVKSYRYRWIHGVTVILTFALLGYFRACLYQVNTLGKDMPEGMVWCVARLSEPPVAREKTVKVILDIEGFRMPSGDTCAEGKVMAYFQKTPLAMTLLYGDMLAFQTPIESVSPPLNPGEFDYRKHLERRGVTGSVFLKEGEWLPLGVRRGNAALAFAYRFRERMMKAMERCGVTGDELSIGTAILLGYDDSLPVQVRHNFVASGAMHILCVSGMHVGIIYMLASFLLGLMGKSKGAIYAKKLLLLALIWFYALITGLSPSILRSALMITMVLFGELIHRKGFTLNSIAASAFVLLLINPNNLFAIGFQLSYVAVVGIVLLQKKLPVSIAAQIATMPFTIYYFNQFTPYFWLSNLLLGPLSFGVILSGMFLLAFSWVPGLNALLGTVVWYGLHWMNLIVAGIEWLPLSLIKGLYIDDIQFGLCLVLLLLFWLFINLRKKRMMLEMLVLSTLFALTLAWRSQRQAQQSIMMAYSVRNHTAIVVAQGFKSVMLCDEELLQDPSSIDYSLKSHWAERQWPMSPPCFTLDEDFACSLAVKRQNLLSASGVLLAFWDPADANKMGPRIKVDYLLVTGKQTPDLHAVLRVYQPGTLLIDGSVPRYLADRWVTQATDQAVSFVNLAEGAVKLN